MTPLTVLMLPIKPLASGVLQGRIHLIVSDDGVGGIAHVHLLEIEPGRDAEAQIDHVLADVSDHLQSGIQTPDGSVVGFPAIGRLARSALLAAASTTWSEEVLAAWDARREAARRQAEREADEAEAAAAAEKEKRRQLMLEMADELGFVRKDIVE